MDRTATSNGYTYIWRFTVAPEHDAAYRAAYGPEGPWVRLFRRAAGYRGTLLLQDDAMPGRYLTIDRWDSAEAHRAFLATFGADYAALDRACEHLTLHEESLGDYAEVVA